MARNLVNLEGVNKAFDIKELLRDVSIGISQGERIGIVGRNGAGKSTLMKVIAGVESPDSGRVRVAERWSDLLGGCPVAFIHKTRNPLIPNESITGRVVGDVQGRTCVVIDDMIDTAGTITKAVDALFDEGAKDVIIAATHAVFSGPAIDRLKNSRASEVVVCDTLPIPVENRFDGLTVLSIAPLIARAIREVFEDGSVTSLFDGHS